MTVFNKNHKQLGLTHRWWNMANSPFMKPYLFWVDAAGAGAGCGWWWWWSFASWKSLRHVSWFHTRPLILVWPCDAMLTFWKGIGNKYAKGNHITFVLDFGWVPFFYGFPILPNTPRSISTWLSFQIIDASVIFHCSASLWNMPARFLRNDWISHLDYPTKESGWCHCYRCQESITPPQRRVGERFQVGD